MTDSCAEATGAFNDGGVDLSAGFESGQGGGGQGESDANSGREQGGGENGGGGEADGDAPIGPGGPDGTNGSNIAPGLVIVRDGFTINCTPGTPCDPNLVVRMSDLVNFRPIAPTSGMEPEGWTVVGLPANFFAAASVHTLSGSLLGFPAEVRFTPVGYHWQYGDGSEGDFMTGGASWAAQGLPEFSETATSHAYDESGSYISTFAVDYAAEYRFASQPWRSIPGTLAVQASPVTVVAGEARTVLVDQGCIGNPRGPGC